MQYQISAAICQLLSNPHFAGPAFCLFLFTGDDMRWPHLTPLGWTGQRAHYWIIRTGVTGIVPLWQGLPLQVLHSYQQQLISVSLSRTHRRPSTVFTKVCTFAVFGIESMPVNKLLDLPQFTTLGNWCCMVGMCITGFRWYWVYATRICTWQFLFISLFFLRLPLESPHPSHNTGLLYLCTLMTMGATFMRRLPPPSFAVCVSPTAILQFLSFLPSFWGDHVELIMTTMKYSSTFRVNSPTRYKD